MARVTQITEKSQVGAEWSDLWDRITAARGRVAGPYSILLHNPAVADKIDALAAELRAESGLTPQEFVLAAMAVARAKDCLFVWSVQAPGARRVSVPEEAITAIRDRTTTGLTEDQADLVAFAQQVTAGTRVDKAVFDRLQQRHGVKWLVGLTGVAGHFGLICGVNNAFEVDPSPDGDKLPI